MKDAIESEILYREHKRMGLVCINDCHYFGIPVHARPFIITSRGCHFGT